MPVAAYLLAGPPIPDKFRARCQTKRDILAFQVRSRTWDYQPHLAKAKLSLNPSNGEAMFENGPKCHRRIRK
jgi:hypothetical protein